jgi:hypothetical protein
VVVSRFGEVSLAEDGFPEAIVSSPMRKVPLLMSHRVGAIALFLMMGIAPRVDAALIEVQFAGLLPSGPFMGTQLSGNFMYDDLGTGNCLLSPNLQNCAQGFITPMLTLSLNFGSYHYGLSQLTAPATVVLPLGSSSWGPSVNVQAALLPTGVTALGLAPGAAVFYFVTHSDGSTLIGQCGGPDCSLSITTRSVPEPAMLSSLAAGALAYAVTRTRRRRAQAAIAGVPVAP